MQAKMSNVMKEENMTKEHKHTKDHAHCDHCLHTCEPCNKAYCCECMKEWGVCHQNHYVYTYPDTTTPYTATIPYYGTTNTKTEILCSTHTHVD